MRDTCKQANSPNLMGDNNHSILSQDTNIFSSSLVPKAHVEAPLAGQ